MKKWLWALVVLALAVPLTAGVLYDDIATIDSNARQLSGGSFFTMDSGTEAIRYSTRTTAVMDTLSNADTLAVCRTTIIPTGIPGRFNFQIPQEATLTSGHFKFFERDQSQTEGYTAGSWVNFYVGAAAQRDFFDIACWDSCWVVFLRSGDGKFNLYWWTENYRN